MFLDGQLRELESRRRKLALRGELGRRLGTLEAGLVRTAMRRALTRVSLGMALARRILEIFRH